MRPARSALFGLILVVAALFACKKNRPLTLSTPSNQSGPPPEAGAPSHKQINADTYSIECWGNNLDCVKEAASVCQKGYDVLANSEGTPAEAGAPAIVAPPPTASDAAAPLPAAPDAAAPPTAAAPPVVAAPADAGPPPAATPASDAGAVRIEMVVKCKA